MLVIFIGETRTHRLRNLTTKALINLVEKYVR